MTSDSLAHCSKLVLGVDTGGAFTDFVLLEGQSLRIHKVLSTPHAPEQAILQGISELAIEAQVKAGDCIIIHGSTVATNAALEGKGAKTAFITNQGFKDMLTIGRQTRPQLYELQPAPVTPPVEEVLCFECPVRVNSEGQSLEAIKAEHITLLKHQLEQAGVEAVAINFLFSFLNAADELALRETLEKDWFVSISSEVLAESGEYERGIATWLNASLGPKVKHYLQRLLQGVKPSSLAVMQSTGGTMDANQAGNFAVNMLLSGPAGGLAAAQFIARQTGKQRLLTFDMGGTSTDVALIDGTIQLTNESHIGPWPVAVAQVDMHTIGAGGGSLAYCDGGGLLQVGPESAGANPGPACYGQGGEQATVTDANAVLGRLQPDYFLGGKMALDLAAAETALEKLANDLGLPPNQAANGIVALANEHMARALRVISVERGYHLDDFHLCCFGGAGGLHVCALAEALGMTHALVPNQGGVLSALGMVVAEKTRQLSHAKPGLLAQISPRQVQSELQQLKVQGMAALQDEGVEQTAIKAEYSVDLRYRGQRFYLNLPWQSDTNKLEAQFHQRHEQRFGHQLAMPVELVNLRCQVSAPGAVSDLNRWPNQPHAQPRSYATLVGFEQPVPVYWRPDLGAGQSLVGPALIAETVSTTLVAQDWQASVDDWGNLTLKKHQP